jgi:adenosylcobyric acid synthase
MGQTQGKENSPFQVTATPRGPAAYADGMINAKGTVIGTYFHGLFFNDHFRQAFLNNLRRHWGLTETQNSTANNKDQEYDKLADVVRQNLDISRVYKIMENARKDSQ